MNDYYNALIFKKDNLDKELQDTSFQIADLGKKMYDLKEELRETLIKLEKWKKENIK